MTKRKRRKHFDPVSYLHHHGVLDLVDELMDTDLDALPSITLAEAEERMTRSDWKDHSS